MEYEHIVHPIEPVYDEASKILILGSFPSVKSREQMFFYGHPRNRFWKVIAQVYGEEEPLEIVDKKAFLLRNHIAVWDVIFSCDIKGSADSAIRNVEPTALKALLEKTKISRIFCNGKTAGAYYAKYQEKETGRKAVVLPSTSPANAAWREEQLTAAWKSELIKQ